MTDQPRITQIRERDEPWLARVRFNHGGGGFCQCPVCDVPDLIEVIDALRARLARAEAALKPFADVAEGLDMTLPDHARRGLDASIGAVRRAAAYFREEG